jgi:hypothetical protein
MITEILLGVIALCQLMNTFLKLARWSEDHKEEDEGEPPQGMYS